jgi:hypothetical protein
MPGTITQKNMTDLTTNSSRRDFLGNALKLGAGSILIGASPQKSAAAEAASESPGAMKSITTLVELPDFPARVFAEHDGSRLVPMDRQGSRFTSNQVAVNLAATPVAQEVRVACPTGPLSRVVLRWEITFPGDTLFLGNHWERGYGDLQWRFLQPERDQPSRAN